MKSPQPRPLNTRVVPTAGCYDCGGRCVLRVHTHEGLAVRVETDEGPEPQLRACARGRAFRQQVYSPQRLRSPLKRTGERGEGRFAPVSWDEALDTVADRLRRIRDTYGPKSILALTYSGSSASLHTGNMTLRQLLRGFGGYVSAWGGASAESSVFSSRATYGTLTTGNTRDDLVNSRLIILWGLNPATSIYSTNTSHHLIRAREAGARIITVDPRYTSTAAVMADQWVPIRPGTDTALMAAMAYIMISDNLYDADFVKRCTAGFDAFKTYIMGDEDGVPKTPAWATAITGVPLSSIDSLAREYAGTRPAALIPGYAPGRTAHGEQYHRMASVLAAMTGNVGIHGGGAAGFERGPVGPMVPPGFSEMYEGTTYEARLKSLDVHGRLQNQPHCCRLWDAILQGKEGGFPTDIKMMYVAFANPLNQFPNLNKGIDALKSLEYIVVHEQFMTATARFADIVLPVTTVWERNDIARTWLSGPYFFYANKVIDPLPGVKSDDEICLELGKRLGVEMPFLELSQEERVFQVAQGMGDVTPEISDFARFKEEGVHRIKTGGPVVSFEKQVQDPDRDPFPTPSGKIEIYSKLIADLDHPHIPPVPKYFEPWESPADPLAEKYPLQLVTVHQKNRAHSCFDNNPWLREIEPQRLSMNQSDAASRGIEDGAMVRVFNDRGETIVRARVTERIMPGVVALGEGAWFRPDEQGRDRAGSPNILTRDDYAPGGGFPYNTGLVQVKRFNE